MLTALREASEAAAEAFAERPTWATYRAWLRARQDYADCLLQSSKAI